VCWDDDEKQAITSITHKAAEIQDVTSNILEDNLLIESFAGTLWNISSLLPLEGKYFGKIFTHNLL
jgi:hypothetical protein